MNCKKNGGRFYPVMIMFLSLIMLSGCTRVTESPRAIKGTLDLTATDLDETGPVKLDGDWEFSWNEISGPEWTGVPSGQISGYIRVPSIWNSQVINGVKLSPCGYGTYRLTVRLKTGTKNFGIKLMSFSSAYRLYANGRLIASNGTAGKTDNETAGQHLPLAAYFTVDDEKMEKTVELVCHVSNFQHPKGGFWHSAFIGTSEQISRLRERSVEKETFYLGIFLIMGIFHIVLFILRPSNSYTLFFALICFTAALRSGFVGENLFVSFFPNIPWEVKVKLEMLTYYLTLPLFSAFLYSFYRNYFSRNINIIIQLSAAIFITALLALPYSDSYWLVNVNTFLLLFFCVYSIYVLCRSYKSFIAENTVFFIGIAVLLTAGIHDILAVNQLIYAPPLYSSGFSVFIISQSFMISIQSARAHSTAESLGRKLEIKVNERTEELQSERNSLKRKNDIIRQDLALARMIQMKLIPSASSDDFISYYYKPMNMVGGDFFDIIKFRDSDNIGVFISDISGHGVQAALLTSMIKTIIMQSGEMREDPAGLLKYINEMLFMHTDINFMTAFYGIIKPAEKELLFCSCAHNHPYLIYSDRIAELRSVSKMIPLGLMPASEIEEEHKRKFVNETASLKGCSKLFLYTDGLTETRSILNEETDKTTPENFEQGRLVPVLEDSRNLSPGELIDGIVKNLIDFRGCSHFEDDICCICIDMDMTVRKV